jgi:hypothetical protein
VFSAGSSNATLCRRLPTQYALLSALHFCVKDDSAGIAAAAGDEAGAAARAFAASVEDPPRAESNASAKTPMPATAHNVMSIPRRLATAAANDGDAGDEPAGDTDADAAGAAGGSAT